ncbi:glycosyltransferase [Aromatoleum toluvorans]|uniref:Glycosyltransferase n=1 Tax=Aromatoleum toluvorans TaxID=92002 RepID=A0ABX1PYZ7_9RHOO|nr:glycosyltransferase [Aromatoleum toluvorans]NMG43326.1 glycosyltransferase [Aromatoleum toluvorans]
MALDLIYLARGRPQRPRANLIQTLHTVEALTLAGAHARLYLPPVPRTFDLRSFLSGMGVHAPIDIRPRASLHSKWGGWPFVLLHRNELKKAAAVYTRVPDFSLLLARTGCPHYLEVHDTAELEDAGMVAPLLGAQAKGVLRGLTVITQAGRDALVAMGFDASRIIVLPSGVDLSAFSRLRALEAGDFADPHCLYVGRISRDRGLPLLEGIAAAGIEVTLIGPRDDEPHTRPPALHIEPAVPHAAVPDALARGSIALMPYQADLRHAATISPIKLFEAMAAGRLVLASDLPPIREVVCDGQNGLLLPPDDPEAWVAAIRQVRTQPERAAEMAQAGRATAQRFGWSERARKLLEFLEVNHS